MDVTVCGGGPALVFGNSADAIVGLPLAVRHPEAVAGLIAHEPPTVSARPAGFAAAVRVLATGMYSRGSGVPEYWRGATG
ncbi:hypothetical protein AB0D57_21795 [Streptomyces sp. NPDC048275]|uniref:hypothetical protein n=1 Tax=Streptomyces sp. NPDC048275 TaxID=3155629 RepID=UPI0033F5BA25